MSISFSILSSFSQLLSLFRRIFVALEIGNFGLSLTSSINFALQLTNPSLDFGSGAGIRDQHSITCLKWIFKI